VEPTDNTDWHHHQNMSLLGNAIKQCTQLESAFDNQVLYNDIISCLSPATRITLARASTSTYVAVDEFTKQAYNINRHLGQYFTKPTTFRTLQAWTGTLISGSSAIQFLNRSQYPGSDLEVKTKRTLKWPSNAMTKLFQTIHTHTKRHTGRNLSYRFLHFKSWCQITSNWQCRWCWPYSVHSMRSVNSIQVSWSVYNLLMWWRR